MNTTRISVTTAIFLVAIAVLTDIADFLLGMGALGILVDIPAALILGICFSHCDVSLMDSKRVGKFLATIVAEATPVVNDFPIWTYTILSTIKQEWQEPLEI